MKRLFLLLGILAFTLPAFAQSGQRVGDERPVISGQTPGGPLYSVPNATINFCNSPANGVPCTNKAITYTSIALNTQCPSSTQLVLVNTSNCVARADSLGNWGVWVSPGTYSYTIQLPNGASLGPYTVTLSGGGGSILPTPNVWTGISNTFPAGGLFVGTNPVAGYSGIFIVGDCNQTASTNPLVIVDSGSACGSGGGAGTVVASPQLQLFYQPNSGSSATAKGSNITTDLATQNNITVPGISTLTGQVNTGGSTAIHGPRPWIDLTAPPYNATGDNSTDDTAAVTAAIAAVCSSNQGGTIIVPTGQNGAAFKVTQAQGGPGSTAATFTTCAGISFEGKGNAGYTLQFMSSPSAKIIANPGASPSAGPLFSVPNALGNAVSFTNLTLACQNQCINNQGSYVNLYNVGLNVQNMGASYADNVTLVEKGFWTNWTRGVVNGGILVIVDNSGNGAYDFTLRDLKFNQGNFGQIGSQNLTGVPIIYDIRQNFGSYPGTAIYDNDTTENVTGSFVTLENSTGNACTSALPAGFKDFTFNHIIYADGAANTAILQDYTGCTVNGIKIQNSNTANGGGGVAVRLSNGGSVLGCTITGPTGYSLAAVDANGNPVPGCLISQGNGIDSYGASRSTVNGYRTDESLANTNTGLRSDPNGFAATPAGSAFRSVMLDPIYGLMLATNTGNYGFTSSISQSLEGFTDLYFANLMPPTGGTGTPTTGGTLANGSYWYAVRAALTNNCNAATQSAPEIIGPVVLTGGNNAVSISLTQPLGLTAVFQYCYQRFTSAPSNPTLQSTANGIISTFSSATTFTDTGTTGAGNMSTASMSNVLGLAHRFFPNGLAINATTLGGFNFNLNGTANMGATTVSAFKDTGIATGSVFIPCVDATGNLTNSGCSAGTGTVTGVGTTSPLSGTVTTSGNLSCPTCVVATSPGAGIAHFAGSTQTVTSSAVNLGSSDVTGVTSIANGGTGAATFAGHRWLGNPAGTTAAQAANLIGTSDVSPNECAADTGSVNALVTAPPVPITSLVNYVRTCFTPANNTTSTVPTLNASSTGAHTITLPGGGALISGQLTTTANYVVIYNSASGDWELQTGAASGGGGGSPGGSTDALQYNAGGGTFGGLNSPVAAGTYNVIYSTPGGAVAPSIALPGVAVDSQSSATPAFTASDRAGLMLSTNNTTSTATALPQAGSAGFTVNYPTVTCNTGSVTNTITPVTSTISGNSTLIEQGNVVNPECTFIWGDNTNYWAAEILPTDANGRLQAKGMGALTGDVTGVAGTYGTTVTGINGTSFAGTSGHLVSFGAANIPADSGIVAANVTTQTSNGASNQVCTYTTTNKVCVPASVTVAMMASSTQSTTVNGVTCTLASTCSVTTGLAFPVSVTGTTTSGGIPYFSDTTHLTSSGLLATQALVVGGGAGGTPTTGNGDFTYATHTLAGGASAIFDVHLLSASNFFLPGALSTGLVTVTTSTGAVSSVTAPAGAVVGTTDTQTLTNKTLTSPTLTTPALGAATATSLLATGIVDGKAPITITTGTSATLGAGTYGSGYTLNQEATAGTGVTYTLPATVTGAQYCVANSGTTGVVNVGVLTIYPAASSYVILKGVVNTVGGGGTHGVASGGAAGDAACFVAIDATHWTVYPSSGTWTEN